MRVAFTWTEPSTPLSTRLAPWRLGAPCGEVPSRAEARARLAAASERAREVIAETGVLHRILVRRTKARREGPLPRDAAGVRRLLLGRLDAAAVVRAQGHRAKTVQRLGDPEQASWIRAETARLAAVASRAGRQRPAGESTTSKTTA